MSDSNEYEEKELFLCDLPLDPTPIQQYLKNCNNDYSIFNADSYITLTDQMNILNDILLNGIKIKSYPGLFHGNPTISNVLYMYNRILKQPVPKWIIEKYSEHFAELDNTPILYCKEYDENGVLYIDDYMNPTSDGLD